MGGVPEGPLRQIYVGGLLRGCSVILRNDTPVRLTPPNATHAMELRPIISHSLYGRAYLKPGYARRFERQSADHDTRQDDCGLIQSALAV